MKWVVSKMGPPNHPTLRTMLTIETRGDNWGRPISRRRHFWKAWPRDSSFNLPTFEDCWRSVTTKKWCLGFMSWKTNKNIGYIMGISWNGHVINSLWSCISFHGNLYKMVCINPFDNWSPFLTKRYRSEYLTVAHMMIETWQFRFSKLIW